MGMTPMSLATLVTTGHRLGPTYVDVRTSLFVIPISATNVAEPDS